jgi:hypothetical protein
MSSSNFCGNIIFICNFKEDISKIFDFFTKQKKIQLIINQCSDTSINFLDSKNYDEIGCKSQLIIKNNLFIKTKTISNYNSERYKTYSQKLKMKNYEDESLESQNINYFFHSNTNDNSTILIVENNFTFKNQNSEKLILFFYEEFCKNIKEYNKIYSRSQIILDSNIIMRPFETLKKNINIFINIFSKFYVLTKKNQNEKLNDFRIIKEMQILNEELEIYLLNNGNKIRISIISLSEISCYIQLMEKFEFISNGKIFTKVSKLNQKILEQIKEYFEHSISL